MHLRLAPSRPNADAPRQPVQLVVCHGPVGLAATLQRPVATPHHRGIGLAQVEAFDPAPVDRMERKQLASPRPERARCGSNPTQEIQEFWRTIDSVISKPAAVGCVEEVPELPGQPPSEEPLVENALDRCDVLWTSSGPETAEAFGKLRDQGAPVCAMHGSVESWRKSVADTVRGGVRGIGREIERALARVSRIPGALPPDGGITP